MTKEWVVYSTQYGDHVSYGPFTSYEAAYDWTVKEHHGEVVPLYRPVE